MKKQILAGILSATMVVGMGGVSVFAADKADDKTYNIGICQLVQHEALDAATKGFEDALKDKLGDDVSFDEQNAAGDAALFRRADTTDYAEGAWDEGQKSIKVRR